ncbi:MAG: DUF4783 domain-containing protein [Bacteroides sp.]|nr:DUF4783 domain-containing protein [Bacteroides sp.]
MIRRLITRILLYVMFVLPVLPAFGQTDAMAREISQAIRQGNAREMSKYFGQNVDLTLPGSEGTFSKSQAEVILRNFFSKNAPKELSVNHQGNSRDGSVYVIGTLQTRNGQTFRTYFLLKKVSDTFRLHQVQFEPQ